MSSQFISAPVPFVVIGNRRALTDEQLVNDPYLRDFVGRFAQCFEYDPFKQVRVYIEGTRI